LQLQTRKGGAFLLVSFYFSERLGKERDKRERKEKKKELFIFFFHLSAASKRSQKI